MAEPWNLRHDMVLYPFMCAAGGSSAYKRIVVGVCDKLLDRRPVCGRLVKYRSLMHVRCVTYGPTGQIPGLIDMAHRLFIGLRTGLPLTWGEKANILRPYYKKEVDPEKTEGDPIPLRDMLLFMDRGESDLPMVTRFIDFLRGGKRTTRAGVEGVGDPGAMTPFDNAASCAEISGLVHRWFTAPDHMMKLAWCAVLEHLMHYGGALDDEDEEPPITRRRNAGPVKT